MGAVDQGRDRGPGLNRPAGRYVRVGPPGATVHRGAASLPPDWDEFVAHHPFAQRRWLWLTETCFRDYEPLYAVVRVSGHIVGAAVAARQRHFNTSAYVTVARLLPAAHRAIHRFPPVSVQVSPFGFPGVITPANATAERRSESERLVLRTLEAVARRTHAPFIGVNNLESDGGEYVAAGYTFVPTMPEAVIDLAHESYAAYEQALPKKYREEVRRVRNRAVRAGVTLEYPRPDELPAADIERLQRAVTAKHHNTFPYRPGYVSAGAPLLPTDGFRMIIARLDGRAVASLGVFRSGTTAVLRWMGLDYERATPAHAYHLVMSESIGQAIELGVNRLVLGATSYVVKKKLGAHLEDRWIAARLTSPAANTALHLGLRARRALRAGQSPTPPR